MKITPPEQWGKITHLLIMLGREICKAKLPDCPKCPLNDICPNRRI